ncbi:MAG TPA: hypothetical protein EYH05_12175 [Anaerolineae bacterium]|nr:hypothetical protein [Anaerolineae bacterium]
MAEGVAVTYFFRKVDSHGRNHSQWYGHQNGRFQAIFSGDTHPFIGTVLPRRRRQVKKRPSSGASSWKMAAARAGGARCWIWAVVNGRTLTFPFPDCKIGTAVRSKR